MTKKRFKKTASWVICIGTIVLFFGLPLIGCLVPGDFLIAILAGAGFYLARVIPQLTIDWGGVSLAILALVCFTFGVQMYGGWISKQTNAFNWSWGRTNQAIWMVLFMFCSGIAMISVGHQALWLFCSDEKWVENNFFEFVGRTQTRGNLKIIGLSLHNYHDQQQMFPPGGTFDDTGRPMHSWATAILPFLDEPDLYDSIDKSIPWDSPGNRQPFQKKIINLRNSGVIRTAHRYFEPVEVDSSNRALTHYAANAQLLGYNRSLNLSRITDGVSQTIFLGEVNENFKAWGDPNNSRDSQYGINKSKHGFGGPFSGGVHIGFADGRATFISENIDPVVFAAMGTPAGGEDQEDSRTEEQP